MPFSKLIGNPLAKSALERMVEQNNVPHALLFYGPEGVGKSLFALALAEELMGKEHAQKLATRNHPDLHRYFPEGKNALHTMENMRKLIDEVALPPYESPVKIFIVDDAHQMLPFSSNALLKTFEEPPDNTYLILITSMIDSILPTMISRCRKIPFFPIPQSQISVFLQNEWQKIPEESRRLAFLSHGSLGKAKILAEQSEVKRREILLEILTLHLPEDYPQFLKQITELEESCQTEIKEEKEEEGLASSSHAHIDAIFEEIVAWYRDLHILKEGLSSDYLYHLDRLDRLKLMLAFPIAPLEMIIEKVSNSRLALQRNVRLRTVLEHFFLSLTY